MFNNDHQLVTNALISVNPEIKNSLRFFDKIHWSCHLTCKHCKKETNVDSKIRYSGASFVDYKEKSSGLNDADKAILDNESYFGPNIHYGFQCQACGALKTTNNYQDLYYTVETKVTCKCGGHLSRHYLIFCPHCKYNKVPNWNPDTYITKLKEEYVKRKQYYQKIAEERSKMDLEEPDDDDFEM